MITQAKPMTLRGGEVIVVHPRTGEPGRWPVDGPPVQYCGVAEIPTGRTWLAAPLSKELTVETTHRQDTIAGLRALADFLEAHPEVPVSGEQVVSYWTPAGLRSVEARTQVDKIAAVLGVTAGPRAVLKSATHAARRRFGPVIYQAAAIGVHPGRVR